MSDTDATAFLQRTMPLAATLGLVVQEAEPHLVRMVLGAAPELSTVGEVLHGGVLMALADSAGAYCAFLNLPEEATGSATITSTTNFLRPVRGGSVTATSTPLHVGATTIVVETTLATDDGRPAAKTVQTQAVRR